MNDEFLYAVRPAVPSGLWKAVLLRMDTLARFEQSRLKQDLQGQTAGLPASRQKVLLATALLLLVGGCTFGILRIGRLVFREAEAPPTLEPGAQVVVVPQQSLPAIEALGRIGFEVELPSWTPPEYELDNQAWVTLPTEDSTVEEAWQVFLRWYLPGTRRDIWLVAYRAEYAGRYPMPVGPGSLEAVDVGGVEGALIRGNWVGLEWEVGMGGNVWWIRGDTGYWLKAESEWVSPDDLLRMASSVR